MKRTWCCAAQNAFGSVIYASPSLHNVHLPVMASCLEGKTPMLGVAKPSAEGLGTLVASWSSWSCGCSASGRKSVHAGFPILWSVVEGVDRKKEVKNTEYISMSSVWAACRGSVPGCLSQISSPGWASLTWYFLCKLGSWKRERISKVKKKCIGAHWVSLVLLELQYLLALTDPGNTLIFRGFQVSFSVSFQSVPHVCSRVCPSVLLVLWMALLSQALERLMYLQPCVSHCTNQW